LTFLTTEKKRIDISFKKEIMKGKLTRYLIEILVIVTAVYAGMTLYEKSNKESVVEVDAESIYTQNNTISDETTLPDPLEAGWNGQKVCEVLEENDFLRILKCTFPPGVGHERHYHAPHVGYTLESGKFRIVDSTGRREVEIPADYVFGNDKIQEHEVLNIGTTTAKFLIIEYKLASRRRRD
jgi:hypothetical protein